MGQSNPPPLRRNRDFMILWSGQAVSALGTSMSVLVFPLIGYAITGSTLLAGVATTAVLLGGVVARLPAGALVDRWPRGRVLLMAHLVGAVCYGSLAGATLAHHLTLPHLVAAGFVGGIGEAFFAPAASAAVRTVVPRPQLPIAYSQNQARNTPPIWLDRRSVEPCIRSLAGCRSSSTRLPTPLPPCQWCGSVRRCRLRRPNDGGFSPIWARGCGSYGGMPPYE